MGREQKKGRAGNARAYITRAKALKKLQLSLTEFRRLCILKGIFPRDPKKKFEGADKTYYLRKDIDFLAHERIIDTIRAENAHRKKIIKAKSKKQLDVLRVLALKTPRANLEHIIVERYPVFTDALRELDDPLCVIAMFASFPADPKRRISPVRVANCKRLMTEFLNFVSLSHSLRRAFVSIKGYYYQAQIEGELLTWITPHRFTQVLPTDVDYSVMLTFLELYECLLHFVNFRLYTSHNLAYPPKIDADADAKGLELEAVVAEKSLQVNVTSSAPQRSKPVLSSDVIEAAKKAAVGASVLEEAESEDDEAVQDTPKSVNANDDDSDEILNDVTIGVDEQDASAAEDVSFLFSNMIVVVGRETPATEVTFVLRAGGSARIIREDDLDCDCDSVMDSITHWVIDRPAVCGTRRMNIEYVQPQYVFDCMNAGVLLPPALYGPGTKLPPHLSPFVREDEDGGYRPWFKDVIERIKAGDTTVMADSAVATYLRSADDANDNVGSSAEDQGKSRSEMESNTQQRVQVQNGRRADEKGYLDEDANDVDDEIEGEDDDDFVENVEDAEEETKAEKELKLLMMSRKKMKQYSKYALAEKKVARRRDTLTARRDRIVKGRKADDVGKHTVKKGKTNVNQTVK